LRSTDKGHHWTAIPKSPVSAGIIGDGTHIYTTTGADTTGHPFYSAPEKDPATWTNLKGGATFKQGGSHLAYDPDHHLLYSNNYQGGLSRVVVP
jgi:hypothetical protein